MRCTVTIDAPKWKGGQDPSTGTERERRAGQNYRDNEFATVLKQMADRISNTNAHEGTVTREEISGSYKFED
jgi:hypothetical protein